MPHASASVQIPTTDNPAPSASPAIASGSRSVYQRPSLLPEKPPRLKDMHSTPPSTRALRISDSAVGSSSGLRWRSEAQAQTPSNSPS